MTSNPKILGRFFSEQGHQNYGYISTENEIKKIYPSSLKHYLRTPIGYRPFTSQIDDKINIFGKIIQYDNDILKEPTLTRIISKEVDQINDVVVPSSISPHVVVERDLNDDRNVKIGSQRFRWNLLFNILVWLIVPLPLWIPFVSNSLAYYSLPCIQGVFVLMWISKDMFYLTF